jgi:hypothetical protein
MRRAVFFPNPFFAPQLNTESEPNCHLAPSRIPRSMIAVDENLCVYSPSGEPWDIVCDVSTVRLMLGSSRSCRICRSRHSRLGRVSGFLLSPGADCACNGVVRHVWRSTFRRRQSESRVREDRSNRRVILVFALIGLLNGYICQPTHEPHGVLDHRRGHDSLAGHRSLRGWRAPAAVAGLRARPAIQRPGRKPAGAHARHPRRLWCHPQS